MARILSTASSLIIPYRKMSTSFRAPLDVYHLSVEGRYSQATTTTNLVTAHAF